VGLAARFDCVAQFSMQRMSEVMTQKKAQLWINHNKAQGMTVKHPPEYYQ
jgi:hypothetical protein